MKRYIYSVAGLMAGVLLGFSSCANDALEDVQDSNIMKFEVTYPSATRVANNAFENGDQIGLFLTENAQELEVSGNYVNNAAVTYDGTDWNTATPIYWNEGTYNAYAYYPFGNSVTSVDNYAFAVKTDQSTQENYAASDFLWASSPNIIARNTPVQLNFSHRMSRILVTLEKSENYGDTELPDEAEVYIHSTVPEATVDLSEGYPAKETFASPKAIKALSLGNHQYAAVIVPQRVDSNIPLIEVISNGVSYLYEGRFVFKTGVQHNVTFYLSKNPSAVKIEIGGQIEGWN